MDKIFHRNLLVLLPGVTRH